MFPEPGANPVCQCRDNPMRAMFCMVGHMTECHFPYDCKTAGCCHLHRYDIEPAEAEALEAAALVKLRAGQLPPYKLGQAGLVLYAGYSRYVVIRSKADDELRVCGVPDGVAIEDACQDEFTWGGPYSTQADAEMALTNGCPKLQAQLYPEGVGG